MGSAFVPPPVSSWEGPAKLSGDFTPPPPSSWEGPAKEQAPGFFSTLGSDLASIPGNLYQAVRHPIDTVSAIGHASKEDLGHAYESMKAGNYQEAADSAVHSIPLVGPMAVGIRDDIDKGNFGRATAHMTELAAPKIAEAAPAVIGAVAPKLRGAASDALQQSAANSYARALGPTTKANKFITSQVAPELIDRGVVAATRKGLLSKANTQVQSLGQQIGDAFDNLPATDSVPLASISQRLQKAADDAMTITNPTTGEVVPMGPQANAGLNHITNLQKTLEAVAETDAQGNIVIPIGRLRKVRQYFDGIAAKAGRYQGNDLADASMAEAHGMAADAIRQELAQQYPDIAAINKEFSFWKNVQKVVGDTIQRTSSQAKPLGEQLATQGGAIVGAHGGPIAAAIGAEAGNLLMKTIRSTAWRTVSAVAKSRLADIIATGNQPAIVAYLSSLVPTSSAMTQQKQQFPASRLAAFASGNGYTPDEARRRLEAEGWTVQ